MNPINELFDFYGDERMKKYPLMASPWPVIALSILYLYAATTLGPRFMKNRRPFELKTPLRIYNIIQIIYSFWIFKEVAITIGWLTGRVNTACYPVDYSESPMALYEVFISWCFLFSKFLDWMDTVFMVLRKKNDQVTNLHLFHHAVMPLAIWINCKIVPGGLTGLGALINGFVHGIMYTYYFLSSFGPDVQKYLRWKKYLTSLQIAQFLIYIGRNIYLINTDCNYPKIILKIELTYISIFLVMFAQFFLKSYRLKKGKRFQEK